MPFHLYTIKCREGTEVRRVRVIRESDTGRILLTFALNGWGETELDAFASIVLDAINSDLHYAVTICEGTLLDCPPNCGLDRNSDPGFGY